MLAAVKGSFWLRAGAARASDATTTRGAVLVVRLRPEGPFSVEIYFKRLAASSGQTLYRSLIPTTKDCRDPERSNRTRCPWWLAQARPMAAKVTAPTPAIACQSGDSLRIRFYISYRLSLSGHAFVQKRCWLSEAFFSRFVACIANGLD